MKVQIMEKRYIKDLLVTPGDLNNRVIHKDDIITFEEFYRNNQVSNHPTNQSLWYSIRNAAAFDAQLREMLEEAITYYKLSKDD